MENYKEIARRIFHTFPKDPYAINLHLEDGIDSNDKIVQTEIIAKFLIDFTVEGMKELFGYYDENAEYERVNIESLTDRNISLVRKYMQSIGFDLIFIRFPRNQKNKKVMELRSHDPTELTYHPLVITVNDQCFYISFKPYKPPNTLASTCHFQAHPQF